MPSDEPPIAIELMFERSALTDDPIFVAYREDREPLRVAEKHDAQITRSNVQFGFFRPGEIGVLTAESAVEGDMSALLDRVCEHFGETDVVFFNVIGTQLEEKLHGFERTERHLGGERMDCLQGEWEVERPEVPA